MSELDVLEVLALVTLIATGLLCAVLWTTIMLDTHKKSVEFWSHVNKSKKQP